MTTTDYSRGLPLIDTNTDAGWDNYSLALDAANDGGVQILYTDDPEYGWGDTDAGPNTERLDFSEGSYPYSFDLIPVDQVLLFDEGSTKYFYEDIDVYGPFDNGNGPQYILHAYGLVRVVEEVRDDGVHYVEVDPDAAEVEFWFVTEAQG